MHAHLRSSVLSLPSSLSYCFMCVDVTDILCINGVVVCHSVERVAAHVEHTAIRIRIVAKTESYTGESKIV